MKKQSKKDRMDEHLGAKHGRESMHKQSMRSRRHEMMGMKRKKHSKGDLAKAFVHMQDHMR